MTELDFGGDGGDLTGLDFGSRDEVRVTAPAVSILHEDEGDDDGAGDDEARVRVGVRGDVNPTLAAVAFT